MKDIKIAYRNPEGAIISGCIYKTEDGLRVAGTAWSKGTFDPRFNYGPFKTLTEVREFTDTLGS